jgi:hypothetical protein
MRLLGDAENNLGELTKKRWRKNVNHRNKKGILPKGVY